MFDIPKPVACPHLWNEQCTWLEDRLPGITTHIRTPPAWCNGICDKYNGPYCGRTTTPADEREYLGKAVELMFDPFFLKRLINNYSRPSDVRVPSVWPIIKQELSYLFDLPYIKGVYLTGSLLVKDSDHKDYDIVILVTNMKDIPKGFREGLPITINGVKAEYFITAANPINIVFTTTLDCDNKVLYVSDWYKLNLAGLQEGIKIVKQEFNGMDQVLLDLLKKQEDNGNWYFRMV